tara:strand:+ start:10594 stop:10992 length:399 start_codon:yes stop_codon:yes gene_type:complete
VLFLFKNSEYIVLQKNFFCKTPENAMALICQHEDVFVAVPNNIGHLHAEHGLAYVTVNASRVFDRSRFELLTRSVEDVVKHAVPHRRPFKPTVWMSSSKRHDVLVFYPRISIALATKLVLSKQPIGLNHAKD